MSEANNTIKLKKNQYKHLTKEDRCKIEALVNQKDENGKRKFNNTYIANYLGVHKSTISRELRKRIKSKIMIRTGHIINKPYNATDAQNDYMFKRALSKGEYVLRKYPKMAKYIEDKIKIDKWAPDVIVGYMEKHHIFEQDGFTHITMQTIYNAIRYHIIDVKLEDTRRMKYNPKYEYHEEKQISESKLPYSIDKRPDEINKRLTFGNFELDTVLGTKEGQHECLMTLTERKTRFLTTDNGSEFSRFLEIIKDTKTQIYFCHPYCSGEKGTNEKSNSMIRYFIPKGSLIENYSYEDINNIANWMNNYPRKILNYKTPIEVLLEEFNDKKIINKIYKLQEKINCI